MTNISDLIAPPNVALAPGDVTLSGDVSGTATFDVNGDVTITTVVADDSHDHIIANVDGLQVALDAKLPLAGGTLSGGISLGSQVGAGVADFSNHLALYSTTYGMNVTSGALNFGVASSARFDFYVNGGLVGRLNNSATADEAKSVLTRERGDDRYASINDAATNGTETWSSTKIANEVAAAGTQGNTTAAPQLSLTTVNANEGTTQDIIIQNYNAAYDYTVSSDNETYVTVSRAGNTVTVTLLNIADDEADTGGTRTATVTVSAFDSANDTFSGDTTVAVTSNRTQIEDAAIQVVDFTAALAETTTVSIESNKAVSTADGAAMVSTIFAQEGAEGAWEKATGKLDMEVKNRISDVGFDGLKVYSNEADILAATTLQVIDDDNAVKAFTGTPYTPSTVDETDGGALTGGWSSVTGEPTWLNLNSFAFQLTNDGRHLINFTDDETIEIYSLATPYDWNSNNVTLLSSVACTALPSTAVGGRIVALASQGATGWLSNDGVQLIIQWYWHVNNSTHAWLMRYTLSTPFDLTTAVAQEAIDQPIYSATYDEGNRFHSVPWLNSAGTKMYASPGDNYDINGYIYEWDLSTPFDLTSGTAVLKVTDASYTLHINQVSPDGTRAIVKAKLDDAGGASDTRIYNTTDWSLVCSKGEYQTGSVPERAYNDFVASKPYVIYNNGIMLEHASATDNWIPEPAYVTLSGNTISGTPDFLALAIPGVPDMKIQVEDIAGNLDVALEANLTVDTAGAWAWNGTQLLRTTTFTDLVVNGDNLEFQVSAMDKGLIIDTVTIDLVREYL